VKMLYLVFGDKSGYRDHVARLLAKQAGDDARIGRCGEEGMRQDVQVGYDSKSLMAFLQEREIAVVIVNGNESIPSGWLTVVELTGHIIVPMTVFGTPKTERGALALRTGRDRDED
jgi:hypothetical protein